MHPASPPPVSASRAYVFLILTTIFWGGNAVAGKLALGHISPMMLNFVRWCLALLAVTLVSLPQLREDQSALKKHWPLLLGLGAIGFTAFNAFLYSAVHYTSAVNAAIEQGGVPVVIFCLNFLFFRIVVKPLQILGFMISLLGVALTAGHGSFKALLSLSINLGDVLMLLAVICYGFYTIALRLRPRIHWKSMMAASALGATLSALPLALWEAGTASFIAPDFTGWLIILYCGLLPALVSQTLYIKSVEIIGPNRAGLFVNLVPVFGTLLSVTLAGEELHLFHIIALALVLGGIAIAELTSQKE